MKDSYEFLTKDEAMKKLKTTIGGLSSSEAKRRIKKYGLNELPKEKQKQPQ